MIETEVTVDLDYRKVRSIEQLMRWAEGAFALLAEPGESIERFTSRLYHHIGKGTTGYTVVEHNVRACSSAVEAVVSAPRTGWKTLFVSGIAHDYGLHLTFSQRPMHGRRKWWWPW